MMANGPADYFKPGDYNALCQRCGFKFKASELKKTWDGLRVCEADWEPRQPQDFVRGVKDMQKLPWTLPEPPDSFVDPANPITVAQIIANGTH